MILGETSLHVRGPMGKVLLAAAAYLFTVTILSRGPLGAVRVLGPRLHQVLDLVLVAGLVASPIIVWRVVPGSDLDTAGIIVVEALAVVLLRMATRTHYRPAPVPVGPAAAGGGDHPASTDPIPAPAPAGGGAQQAAAAPEEGGNGGSPGAVRPGSTGRPLPSTAWTLGVLTARARRRGTGSDRTLGAGARRLGTALGRTSRRPSD